MAALQAPGSKAGYLHKTEVNIGGALNPKKISHIRFGILSGPDMSVWLLASESKLLAQLAQLAHSCVVCAHGAGG